MEAALCTLRSYTEDLAGRPWQTLTHSFDWDLVLPLGLLGTFIPPPPPPLRLFLTPSPSHCAVPAAIGLNLAVPLRVVQPLQSRQTQKKAHCIASLRKIHKKVTKTFTE